MNIYLTFEREKKLRTQSEKTGKTVSTLVGEWIDSFTLPQGVRLGTALLEDKPIDNVLKPMCERPFCKIRSEGKYRVVTNDGTDEWIGNLCTFHWNKARKEGEVSEV